jgi:hypothetical protein
MDNPIDKGFASVILTDTDLASKENEEGTGFFDGDGLARRSGGSGSEEGIICLKA